MLPIRDTGIRPPGYRLPDSTRVGAIRLVVSDLARSIDFYQRVLGLQAEEITADAAVLGPAGGRPFLHLETTPGVKLSRRGAFGLFHFAIRVPDRAALGQLVEHLSALRVPAGTADHEVSEAVYLQDPDGLGIEVYEDRPRAAWRQRGGELVMTTEPLDVSGVVAVAGGVPWAGMPAGTVIGHMHLHVGDLEEAEAFYHRALGFDKTAWSYPGALFFAAGGYHHHLGTNVWSQGPAASEDEARLVEWEVAVPTAADAGAAARSLASFGYAVEQAGDAWHAADPWGTALRIVAK